MSARPDFDIAQHAAAQRQICARAETAARWWQHPDDEPPADTASPWLAEMPVPGAPILEWARDYARFGIEIMPRRAATQRDAEKFGCKVGDLLDQLTGSPRTGLIGEAEVASFWRDNPRTPALAVVGGPASGVLAIDVDQHEGGDDGLATLRDLERQHGPLPPAPMVLSPTGRGASSHTSGGWRRTRIMRSAPSRWVWT
jgi:hypothetical protein